MDSLFTDLAAENGDLATNVQGDLYTVSGIDNLTTVLQRRFETPLGALFYDTTYGNPVFNRLSQPMGPDFEKDLIADATSCLLGDRRVQSVTITTNINRETRTIIFYAAFVAIDGTSGSFEVGVSFRV